MIQARSWHFLVAKSGISRCDGLYISSTVSILETRFSGGGFPGYLCLASRSLKSRKMMRARFLWKPKNRYLTWVVSFFVAWYIVHAILGYPKVRDSSVPEFLPFPQQPLASLSTSPHSRPKVFVIGLSKTGTTSLGDALSRLSFRRVGWEDIRSRFLFRSYLNHDLTPLV
jgi:hypothetical protein